MQLTVEDFLGLSSEVRAELINLNFWNVDEEIEEDFALLTDATFMQLCEVLPSCQLLARLELCENNIGNLYPARIERLFASIASCKLKILDLSGNNLDLLDLNILASLASLLATSQTLETIILNNNGLNNLAVAKLEILLDNLALMNLTRLDLAYNDLSNNMEIISYKILNYPCLKSLNLSGNKLANEQQLLALFANLRQITYLNLANNNLGLIQAPELTCLVQHNLEKLDVENNQLGRSCNLFNFIMQQSKAIKYLNLSNNNLNLLGDHLNFAQCYQLETLILAGNDFRMLEAENFHSLVRSIKTSATLKELDLADTNLGSLINDDLNSLLEGLIDNQGLITLNLADNKLAFNQKSLKLGDLLIQNKLEKLDLSNNSLGMLPAATFEYFIAGLACSCLLKVLNISSNELQLLNVNLLSRLAEALKHCVNLETLNLGDQNFGLDHSVKLSLLFSSLAELPNLTKLDLSYMFTDELALQSNAMLLSQFMQKTTSLTSLKLDPSFLAIEQQIKQMLSSKPSLQLKFT